jgi:hypothetical protein
VHGLSSLSAILDFILELSVRLQEQQWLVFCALLHHAGWSNAQKSDGMMKFGVTLLQVSEVLLCRSAGRRPVYFRHIALGPTWRVAMQPTVGGRPGSYTKGTSILRHLESIIYRLLCVARLAFTRILILKLHGTLQLRLLLILTKLKLFKKDFFDTRDGEISRVL